MCSLLRLVFFPCNPISRLIVEDKNSEDTRYVNLYLNWFISTPDNHSDYQLYASRSEDGHKNVEIVDIDIDKKPLYGAWYDTLPILPKPKSLPISCHPFRVFVGVWHRETADLRLYSSTCLYVIWERLTREQINF